ncbi:MAG TPA: hypothetical protein PK569_21895 [Thermoanaerobaculia bacterium]|nr:hypothetical protein [Thermoanaerobaculia bacterium]
MTRASHRSLLLGVVVGFLAGLPALGQISSEEPPAGRTLPVTEQVEQEMATARFRLGPIRLLPFLKLHDIGGTNNVLATSEGTIDDVTACDFSTPR